MRTMPTGSTLALALGLALAGLVAPPAADAQIHLRGGAGLQAPGEARTEWQRTFGMRALGGGGSVRLDERPMFGASPRAERARTAGAARTQWQHTFGLRSLDGGGNVPVTRRHLPGTSDAASFARFETGGRTEWQRVFGMRALNGGGNVPVGRR
jgi:hypothetical protein